MQIWTNSTEAVNDPALPEVATTVLRVLFEEERSGWVVLEASEDPLLCIQACQDGAGTLRVEYRDGSEGRHYIRGGVGADEAVRLFCLFSRGDESWRRITHWRDVSDCFPELRETSQHEFRDAFPAAAFQRRDKPPDWFRQMVRSGEWERLGDVGSCSTRD